MELFLYALIPFDDAIGTGTMKLALNPIKQNTESCKYEEGILKIDCLLQCSCLTL
jgi:hypothetical protein